MNKHLMRQAQQLQAKLEKTQEELANTELEASSGGGAVTVVVTGQQEIKSVKISPEVVNAEDVEMLEDLVMSAVSEAMRESRELAASRLGALTGGRQAPRPDLAGGLIWTSILCPLPSPCPGSSRSSISCRASAPRPPTRLTYFLVRMPEEEARSPG